MDTTARVPPIGPPDSDLITAAQNGDVSAFGCLVRRHQVAAIRVAAIALGSETGADDVAQEAFVKAYGALGRFRPGARFEPWLFRIVTNTARNSHRGAARHRALTVRASNRASIAELSPEEVAAHNVDRLVLVEALSRLSPTDRLVLTYRWYEEMSEAEIAAALGCRRGTVKSRLNRAMTRLQREMKSEMEDK